MTVDEQVIAELEDKVGDLDRELRQAISRAEDAEALADKYREALTDIEYSARQAMKPV